MNPPIPLLEAGNEVTKYSSQDLLKYITFADGGSKKNPRIVSTSKNKKDVVVLQIMDDVLHVPKTHLSNSSKGLMNFLQKKENSKYFYIIPRQDALQPTGFVKK